MLILEVNKEEREKNIIEKNKKREEQRLREEEWNIKQFEIRVNRILSELEDDWKEQLVKRYNDGESDCEVVFKDFSFFAVRKELFEISKHKYFYKVFPDFIKRIRVLNNMLILLKLYKKIMNILVDMSVKKLL